MLPTTSEMSPYCCWLLLLPSLHTYVLCGHPCGEMKYVAGEVSGDVLLQVDIEGVTEISWVFLDLEAHIAITKPNQSVQSKAHRFKHRLYNGTNGSLNITKLTKADQGEFVANVILIDERECNQNYNLTVFSRLSDDDIKIQPNITQSGTCDVNLTCTVDKTDATVAWRNPETGFVEKTPNVQVMEAYANLSWTCEASNAKTNVSKTIIPLDICQNENEWNITVVVIASLLLLAAAVAVICYVWKKQKNVCTRIQWNRKGRLTTESDDFQQTASIYCEIDQSKEACGKTRTAARTGNLKIETVYMTVIQPSVKSAYKGGILLQSNDIYCN